MNDFAFQPNSLIHGLSGEGVQNLIPADIEFQTASRIGCLSSAPLLSITGVKWINRQFGNAFNCIYLDLMAGEVPVMKNCYKYYLPYVIVF